MKYNNITIEKLEVIADEEYLINGVKGCRVWTCIKLADGDLEEMPALYELIDGKWTQPADVQDELLAGNEQWETLRHGLICAALESPTYAVSLNLVA